MKESLETTALEPASLSSSIFMKQSVILVFTEPGASLTGPGQNFKNSMMLFPKLKVLHRIAPEEHCKEDIRWYFRHLKRQSS